MISLGWLLYLLSIFFFPHLINNSIHQNMFLTIDYIILKLYYSHLLFIFFFCSFFVFVISLLTLLKSFKNSNRKEYFDLKETLSNFYYHDNITITILFHQTQKYSLILDTASFFFFVFFLHFFLFFIFFFFFVTSLCVFNSLSKREYSNLFIINVFLTKIFLVKHHFQLKVNIY